MWLSRSRYHLFRTVQIVIRTPDRNLDTAFDFFQAVPSVSGYVQNIHIRADSLMQPSDANMPPQNGIDLQTFTSLMLILPNLASVDMHGVYPIFESNAFINCIHQFTVPSLRFLTMRDVEVPGESMAYFVNLTSVLDGVQELHLIRLHLNPTDPDISLPWDGFGITKLELLKVPVFLDFVPPVAFKNLTLLDVGSTFLLYQAGKRLAALYDTLEEFTLRQVSPKHLQFVMAAWSVVRRSMFSLASCSRLKSIRFLDSSSALSDYSPGDFFSGIRTVLKISPSMSTLRSFTAGIGVSQWHDEMLEHLNLMDWNTVQNVATKMFPQLETFRITGVPESRHLAPVWSNTDVVPIPAAWRNLLQTKFSANFLNKVVFD